MIIFTQEKRRRPIKRHDNISRQVFARSSLLYFLFEKLSFMRIICLPELLPCYSRIYFLICRFDDDCFIIKRDIRDCSPFYVADLMALQTSLTFFILFAFFLLALPSLFLSKRGKEEISNSHCLTISLQSDSSLITLIDWNFLTFAD